MKIKCPYCGVQLSLNEAPPKSEQVYFCDNLGCPMSPPHTVSVQKVEVHNQLCEYVRWGKEAKKLVEKPPYAPKSEVCSNFKGIADKATDRNLGIDVCLVRLKAAMEENDE